MTDQERMNRPQSMSQDQEAAPTAAESPRDVVDDVLAAFLAPTAAAASEVTGAATERPALRTVSAEEFVKRFRQETGE